jgi:hypothetical protein
MYPCYLFFGHLYYILGEINKKQKIFGETIRDNKFDEADDGGAGHPVGQRCPPARELVAENDGKKTGENGHVEAIDIKPKWM